MSKNQIPFGRYTITSIIVELSKALESGHTHAYFVGDCNLVNEQEKDNEQPTL